MQIRYAQLAFKAPLAEIVRTYRELSRYKGRYKGKRCFIIGNGPSLKGKDLDELKDEVTFAANKIYKIFPETVWRPTFYCVQDEKVLLDMDCEALKDVTNQSEKTFVRMQSFNLVQKNKIKLLNSLYLPIMKSAYKTDAAPFANLHGFYVYDGDTVTYATMQLAAYMGFDEIFLIGMDHNFPFRMNSNGVVEINDLSVSSHFFDGAENNYGENAAVMRSNNFEFVTASYQNAEVYSRNNGTFRIYNATRGGILEVFERVSLDEILGKEKGTHC